VNVDEIRALYRAWKQTVKHQQRATGQRLAAVRNTMGFDTTLDKEERDAIGELAQAAIDTIRAGKPVPEGVDAEAIRPLVELTEHQLHIFDATRRKLERCLRKWAKELPVWTDWAEHVLGFGALGLAKIIGECGDLTRFHNPAKLWKWCCLHVGADGEAGQDGSHQRKALLLYHVGEPLMKIRGRYRFVYEVRRAHTSETHPDWTKGHSHAEALRFITKRLLRDLWRAWNTEEEVLS